MKLKTMLNLLRSTCVTIHCDDRSLLSDDAFIIHDCNHAFVIPKELLKCKVTAVIPDYTRHSINIYVMNK